MREQVFLLCVITLLRGASGHITKKNCDDCTLVTSCQAAAPLMLKRDSDAYRQLGDAFCGYEQQLHLPKVCCSMLSNANQTTPAPVVDTIEGHPNLQLLPESCGAISEKRILGGLITELYDYPWMVLIAYNTTRQELQFQCSGSLINERYVLTAAHCITDRIAEVRIGEHVLETTNCQESEPLLKCEGPVQDLRIAEAIVHPDYRRRPRFSNDIGILRLKRPANLTYENAKTICLPVTKELRTQNVSGSYAKIAGWGVSGTGYTSRTLLATDVLIHTQDDCSNLYNRYRMEFTDKLCAGPERMSTRTGDDGGPLIVAGSKNGLNRFIQYGIYAFGYRGPHDPIVVYTDVRKHMKWILDTIKP